MRVRVFPSAGECVKRSQYGSVFLRSGQIHRPKIEAAISVVKLLH